MKKIIIVLTVVLLLFTACSNAAMDGVGKELGDAVENIVDSENQYVNMVKGGHRESDTSMTYNEAFSSFFGTPRWTYFESEDEQNIVEFTGDCTYQNVPVKARIQFVVDEENGTFDATYLAFNEVPQDMITLAVLIEKAFENSSTDSSEITSVNNDEQIFIMNVPLQTVMEMSKDEIIKTFGEPDTNNDDYYGTSIIEYGKDYAEMVSFGFELNGEIKYIDGNAERFTYKGQSLSQSEENIAELFGKTYDDFEEVRYFFLITWFWNDYSLRFMFDNDELDDRDFNARSISVEKMTASDNNMTTDSDIYGYEDDNDYYSMEIVDPKLVGRWRANDGGALEIESNGLISSVDFTCWSLRGEKPDSIYCYTDNGRVTCTAYNNHETIYDFTLTDFYDKGEVLNLSSFGSNYYRKDGETGSGLIGTWICIGLSYWTFRFYEDGTGIYNDKYPITWYTYTTDDNKKVLSYVTADTTYFDYYISGDILTIYLSDGSRTYTKIA